MYLELSGIKKSYRGRTVLSGVGFSLPRGRVLAVAGANGAGKTTLLSILCLMSKPDEGSYTVDGRDALLHPAAVRRRIAYVPQQTSALPELTVYDNLRYWAGRKADIAGAAEALGLSPYLGVRASALSGGYMRRLDLAVAQMAEPELLIMDEPLSGVDIDTRLYFMRWVRGMAERGTACVYTTHHTDEIAGTADHLAIVYSGGLKFIEDIEGLYLDNLISRFIRL